MGEKVEAGAQSSALEVGAYMVGGQSARAIVGRRAQRVSPKLRRVREQSGSAKQANECLGEVGRRAKLRKRNLALG